MVEKSKRYEERKPPAGRVSVLGRSSRRETSGGGVEVTKAMDVGGAHNLCNLMIQ